MSRPIRTRQPDFPPFRSDPPSVSIVIVTYTGAAKYLERCLDAVRRLDYPARQVIIVDNPGSDDTREVIARCRRDETVILNDRNLGFAGGCNVGIAAAHGEVIVLLNADTEVAPDWLAELVRPMKRDARAAITGCKMYYPGTRMIQHAGGVIYGNGMVEHLGYQREDNGEFDEEKDVDYVTGAGMAIRRELLDLCGGGLDEDYYPAYYEELDLCHRAHLMGYRVVYAPRSLLVHHESPTVKNQSETFKRLLFRGRLLFCIKHYRLRDWLFRFIPYEIRWLRAPWSKGVRKKQIRAYLDALDYLRGKRYSADNPFPGPPSAPNSDTPDRGNP
jgi:O-antigen biosynthesis protein